MVGFSRFQKRKTETPATESNEITSSKEDAPAVPDTIVATSHRRSPSDVSGDWGAGSIAEFSNAKGDDFSFAGSTDQDFFSSSNASIGNDFMDETENASYFEHNDNETKTPKVDESLAQQAPTPKHPNVSVGFSRFASQKPAATATPMTGDAGPTKANSIEPNVLTTRAAAAVTPNHRGMATTEKHTPTPHQEGEETETLMSLLYSTTPNGTQPTPLTNRKLSRDKTRRVSLEQCSAFPRGQHLSKPSKPSNQFETNLQHPQKQQRKLGTKSGSILLNARPQTKPVSRPQLGTTIGNGDQARFQPRTPTK